MRRRCALAAAGLSASLLPASPALAQHCEPPAAPDASFLRAALRAEGARYESGDDSGFYEGLAIGAAVRRSVLHVRASLPYYRLFEPSGHAEGFGDLESKLEVLVVNVASWSVGGAFAASFPTGNAEKRLGMGHVMLGPSAWVSRGAESVFVSAELGYMGALDGDEAETPLPEEAHHHHAENAHHTPGGPIPNPMNAHEAWVGVSGSYAPARWLRLVAGGTGAVPTSDDGETRATVRGGVELPVGALETGIGAEVDVLGFTRRAIGFASVGWLF